MHVLLFNLCRFTVSVELAVALLLGQCIWYAPSPSTFCAYALSLGLDWGMSCVSVLLLAVVGCAWLLVRCVLVSVQLILTWTHMFEFTRGYEVLSVVV